jgi:error-prone DNA polymerase
MDGRGDGKHGGPPGRDMLGPIVRAGQPGAYTSPGARKEKARVRAFERSHVPAKRARPYAELRVASAFSFLNGSSLPEDLVQRAAALDLPAMALVDTNGLSGAPRFWKAAKAAGVKALVGAEVVLAPHPALVGGRSKKISLKGKEEEGQEAEARGARSSAPRRGSGESPSFPFEEIPGHPHNSHLSGPLGLVPPPLPAGVSYPRLTLLAENQKGYRNLCSLLTAAAAGKPKGQAAATWEEVSAHAEGLHVLTGGEESVVTRALTSRDAGGFDAARRELDRLKALFPGRVHVELQRHFLREEEHLNRALLDLGHAQRLPVLATNGARYAERKGKDLFDALTCIRHHTHLDAAGTKLHAGRERHLKSPADMEALFADLPGVLEKSAELAGRLSFTLADLGYRFPAYPLPPGETPSSFLRHVTWEGARVRFRPLTGKAQAQIQRELDLIEKLDLAGYFLIVWDIVNFCKKEHILVQGRGSAANSAVCYALSITAVDPVKMELLFERFLSEERGEWPDIDLDLPSGDPREKVIQHVYKSYGADGAAMTANVITYRDRSAAREMAKALGFSPEQVDSIAKHLGTWSFGEYKDGAADLAKEMAAAGFDPAHPRVAHFGKLFMRVQSLPRHLGQHSGGMVVAMGRLSEVVPLEPAAMEGRVVIQWDKDDCADLGIVKVDLLGLGMLGAIEKMLPLIKAHEGVDVDLAHLPAGDPKVYEMLNAADTIGLFQVESRAQMASLPRHAPKIFYDIVVQVAIIRPGPIVGGMVHPFFDRRQGKAPVEYPHPCLEPILKRTLGVPLFQEQLLKIAMVAAGFTGGEAEELRRAMGFKRSQERMGAIEERLRSGMAKNGITGPAQDQIVKSITSFALYGFPESHAASFALIAYASAWLKAHHPAAFTACLLNAWPMGFYHPATIVKDIQRKGTKVLRIDANYSGWECRVERSEEDQKISANERGNEARGAGVPLDARACCLSEASSRAKERGIPAAKRLAVRLGMRFIKGLKETTGNAIENERTRGFFEDVADLQRRCALRPDEITRLAYAGALSSLNLSRRKALWQVAEVSRPLGTLYEDLPLSSSSQKSPLPEMSAVQETTADYRATDLTAGPHLLEHLRPALAARSILSAEELKNVPEGERVKTAGAVIVRQRPGTAKGFVFLSLEDESGIVQAIVRPDLFREHRSVIVGSGGLVVEGKLQKEGGNVSVRAERFWPLPALPDLPSHDFR